MSQGVPSVSSAEIGIASGFMGAGVGYILAPAKYDLEELLTQEPDIFEKSLPKSVISKQAETQKNAYHMIVDARTALVKAAAKNTKDAKLAELTKTPYLESAYHNIKSYIPKARTEYAVFVGILAAFAGMVVNYISNPRN